jgi:hypothetical protein
MQDGRIILVTVDGRRPGYSVGMTNFELALTLAYKLVRPSTVNARLIAPDGSERPVDVGAKTTLGTYRFPWAENAPEGRWRFVVDATDDLGRVSQAERQFFVNLTLGSLRAPSVRRRATLRAAFTLTRAAQVRATVLTATGATVRTLAPRALQAGSRSVAWRAQVRAGRYRLRVTAQNELGAVTLTAPFTVRGR